MRDYKAELDTEITRRDFLLKNMESHKNFTVPFIKNVVSELITLESNITGLTTCLELDTLRKENII